jgi:Family of unknown function (DUF6252)
MIIWILTGTPDIFMERVSDPKEYFCSVLYVTSKSQNLTMRLRLRSLLLTLVLFSLISCTKELSREGSNGPGKIAGDFYATIGGNLWNADSLQLVLVSSDGVSINGLSKTGDQISILLPVFQVGTYTLNAQSLSYALFANLLTSTTNVYVSNAGTAGGTVTISSIDTVNRVVSGSFEFTLTNPADNSTETVAKGVFDYVPYNTGTGGAVPPGTPKDTVEMTVDGNKFFASETEISDSAGQMLVAGFSGTQDVGLLFPSDITAGTYNLDFTTGMYIGIYNPDPSTTLLSQTGGTITIISNNTTTRRVTGTFNFVATPLGSGPTANLTGGYFAANY